MRMKQDLLSRERDSNNHSFLKAKWSVLNHMLSISFQPKWTKRRIFQLKETRLLLLFSSLLLLSMDDNHHSGCYIPPETRDTQRTDNVVDFAQHIIYTTILPIVCIAGIFAASICVIIFTRPQMRSSLSIYLAGLSFFDLILLLVSLLIYPPMQICLQNNVSFLFFISFFSY